MKSVSDHVIEARIETYKSYPFDMQFTAEFIVRLLQSIQKEIADGSSS